MTNQKITEYTFEIKKNFKVYMTGKDSDFNYEKAVQEAIKQVDMDWLECVSVNEYTEYEKEAV